MDFEYLGPYRVEKILGRGGMGTVYLGTHANSGDSVALKVIASTLADQERFRRRFAAEVETLKRLKRGELVLLFPEGTRTNDGEVQAIKPGFCALARRAEVPLVPVAVDGAFDAWPRQRSFPRPAVIHVQFGEPILPAQVKLLSDEQLVREVESRIRACHARARTTRRRAAGIGNAKLAS